MSNLLYTVAVILIIGWLVGFFVFKRRERHSYSPRRGSHRYIDKIIQGEK
jgi:hypothetical protein